MARLRIASVHLLAVMLTAASGLSGPKAIADWADTFPNGSPQQFWLQDSSSRLVLTSATFFSTGTASGGMILAGSALTGTNFAYGIVPTDSFAGTGVVVRSVVNPTQSALAGPEAGVIAQFDSQAGSAYMATINYSSTTSQSTLRISEVSSTIAVSGSSRLPFSPTNSYIVELETLGPLLLARAYDSTGSSIVSQVSVFDASPLVQGFAGVGLWQTGSSRSVGGTWGTTSAATPAPSLVWTPAGTIPSGTFPTSTWSGTWSTAASNWFATTGTATRWDSGKVAVFGGNSTTGTAAGGTVTVTGTAGIAVAKGMRFTVDGYRMLSGSQGPVTLSGTTAPFIDVVTGAKTTISARLSGTAGFRKTGGGTLVLDGTNSLTGNTTVQGGVARLANESALATSRLVVVAGGTAQVAPTYLTTTVAGLDLAGGGLVNVTNGALVVASGLSATDLVAKLIDGRNGGSWDGTSGITSSVAAAQVAVSEPRAVGWLDNGDGSMTVAYAAPGDTNLDWTVDLIDVANFISSGKYGTGEPATWAEGDFNYDGVVDLADVVDFSSTGLYGIPPYNPPPGGGIAAVPEPAACGALTGAGFAAWLGKRLRSYRKVRSCSLLGG
ncbi:MAG: hypothetical protein FJ284_11650 [Planctomycetes bacterium]|nr:hypothetical protein [Planctomycetota bacterium]